MTTKDLRRLGLRLEYLTAAWNAFEGIAALAAGIAAHSVSLTAYGLDSSVEVFASGVAIWQLRADDSRRDDAGIRLISVCFLAVAIWVGIQAVLHIVREEKPIDSPIGIVLTSAAVVVMVLLGVAKNRVGKQMSNPVLIAEARFSLVDAALSGTVLFGLLANTLFGWWWADSAVALILCLFAAKEGIEGLRRKRSG